MMGKPTGLPEAIKALQEWREKAADPGLRNIDTFAMQVSMGIQAITKRLDKLEAKLDALAATGDLAWQSGWLPVSKDKNGKSSAKSDGKTLPEGAVPTLTGGHIYPTYL